MKIKIYNKNGVVKITKITASGEEQTMFSNLHDGEVAEINIDFEPSVYGRKTS